MSSYSLQAFAEAGLLGPGDGGGGGGGSALGALTAWLEAALAAFNSRFHLASERVFRGLGRAEHGEWAGGYGFEQRADHNLTFIPPLLPHTRPPTHSAMHTGTTLCSWPTRSWACCAWTRAGRRRAPRANLPTPPLHPCSRLGRARGSQELTMLKLAIAHVNQLRPKFLLISGDLTNAWPSAENARTVEAQAASIA